MKTGTKIVSMLVLMVFCFSAYEAYAFGGHGGRGFEGKHLKWILAKAGVPLTDEQKTQIKGIFQQNREQMKAARTALFQARRDLKITILSGQLPEDQIKGQVDANIVPQISKLAENRAVLYNQIVWNVLTSEQRAALQAQASSKQAQP
jgi:Spy/CpxP family protein refolding chaperone